MIQFTARRIILQLLSGVASTIGIVMLVTKNATSGSFLITAGALLLVISVYWK